MDVTKKEVLQLLPPYEDKWETVTETQEVSDIVRDILKCHNMFSGYYDKIAMLFYDPDLGKTCDNLYNFCKKNIRYSEENEKIQTTALPTGILIRGHGDCKHFSSFIGGCLSAIARETGIPIDWHYCFASYKATQETPYHVFVVVNAPDGEIWIDPTPGAADQEPVWVLNKKPRAGAVAGQIGKISRGNRYIGSLTPNYLAFTGAGQGKVLDSIPGYPDDLPKLQLVLNPDGTNPRLCFYNYPEMTSNMNNWYNFPVQPPNYPHTPAPEYLTDWNPMNTYGTFQIVTSDEVQAEKAAYAVGRVFVPFGDSTLPTVAKNRPAMTSDPVGQMQTPKLPNNPTISALPVQRLFYRGVSNYALSLHPWQWIMENVQAYVNKYLTVPYVLTDLIPYGSNWVLQFQNATTGRNAGKLSAYLSGCNFLVQPLGKMDFWDKFYLVAPVLITAVAALESGGAYAPALIAAVGALYKKYVITPISTQTASTTAIEAYKGTPANVNTPEVQKTLAPPAVIPGLNNNILLIGLAALMLVYGLDD